MVVVMQEQEAEPMLRATSFEDENNSLPRRSSIAEAYKNISISMMADPLYIKSPQTTLQLLSTAIGLQNMPLVKQCVGILDQHLHKDNVLLIYSHLSKNCNKPEASNNGYAPSAPPIIENEHQMDTNFVEDLLESLRHNCLLVIDTNADYILKQKELMKLSYNDFLAIVDRDTLEISSELSVYSAVYRWGLEECTRMTLNTHLNKEVLRHLCYVPRYGLMSKKDFCCRSVDGLKGPTRSGVLEEKEWRLIKFFIEDKSKGRPVKALEHKMSQPRVSGSRKPLELSPRSARKASESTSIKRKTSTYTNKNKFEKCIINFLTCWTAIFD